VRHILGENCAEIFTDKPRQAAYEIFSIERRFRWSTSRHGVSQKGTLFVFLIIHSNNDQFTQNFYHL